MAKKLKTRTVKKIKDRERKRPEIMTPEQKEKAEILLGRRVGSNEIAHENILGILCDRGYISDQIRDRGYEFSALFRQIYQPHAQASAIGDLPGNGSISLPPENADERDEVSTAKLKRDVAILKSVKAFQIVRDIAVYDEIPDFLRETIQGEQSIEKERMRALNNFTPTPTQSILQQNIEVNKFYDRSRALFAKREVDLIEVRFLEAGLQALIDGGR